MSKFIAIIITTLFSVFLLCSCATTQSPSAGSTMYNPQPLNDQNAYSEEEAIQMNREQQIEASHAHAGGGHR